MYIVLDPLCKCLPGPDGRAANGLEYDRERARPVMHANTLADAIASIAQRASVNGSLADRYIVRHLAPEGQLQQEQTASAFLQAAGVTRDRISSIQQEHADATRRWLNLP